MGKFKKISARFEKISEGSDYSQTSASFKQDSREEHERDTAVLTLLI